jgi:hypothetical protein
MTDNYNRALAIPFTYCLEEAGELSQKVRESVHVRGDPSYLQMPPTPTLAPRGAGC